jgi:signal peptidase I
MSIEPEKDTPIATKEAPKHEDFWVELLKTVGVAVVLAVFMRQFVAEARFIPSGSMEPTLQVDDRLIVDKVSYRLSNPKRGDIVVFDPTDALLAQNYKEAFIKRIIGLPGDKVTVVNDKVTINGQPLSENYPSWSHAKEMAEIYDRKREERRKKLEECKKKQGSNSEQGCLSELSDKTDTQLWQNGKVENSGGSWEGTVPANQYLVLGDHRSGSLDGRAWGYVPRDRIVGKAMVRFWPLNRLGDIQPHPSYGSQHQK